MVLGAPLLEEVEEECLLVVPMEEGEPLARGKVVVANDHHPLSDSAWLSLALTSADSEDAVCTTVAVAPG